MTDVYTETAIWRHIKMEIYFRVGYRIGSSTRIYPSGTGTYPDETLLKVSLLWADGGYRDALTLQEFVNKMLGD